MGGSLYRQIEPEKHVRSRRILSAPAVLVPALLVLTVAAAMVVAAVVIDEPEVPVAALYEDLPAVDATPTDNTGAVALPSEETTTAPSSSTREPVLLAAPAVMRIESIDVQAELIVLGIEVETGNMAAPDGPDLVGWYDFTGRPGSGTGNAVFAAHRDWEDIGPAVFFNLGDLAPGDTIEVFLHDGSVVQYEVTAAHTYDVEAMDMREILAVTEQETITLITCAGLFEDGDYTDRHVVRAIRSGAVRAGS